MHAPDSASSSSGPLRLPTGSRFVVRLLQTTALLLPLAGSAGAADLQGRVVAVADGDTITVIDASRVVQKVRLAGIDAPERNQPYGPESRKHLVSLVLGQSVNVRWRKRDRYGRLVGEVQVAVRGACGRSDCARVEDVGLAQVESGCAWHYKQYQNEQSQENRRRYALAEQKARAVRQGLWHDAHPVPPWEYRHGSGRARASRQSASPSPSAPDR